MNLAVRLLKLTFIYCLVATANAATQTNRLDGLDAFVTQARKASGTPGLAVAVVLGDEVILARGYGVLETGKDQPVDENTLFAIGSNTKYFTATALGMLAEEATLSLDDPLTSYLPHLRFSDPYLFTELTVRDALSHRSGLQRADLAWYVNPGKSRGEILAMIQNLSLEQSFRSGLLYNNFLFLAAGQTIPAVTGQTWDDFINQRLFKPLQMTRSNTSVRDLGEMSNVAVPHSLADAQAVAIPYYNIDQMAPAGSINSSVSDMAQWCKVQINGGKLNGKQIIPEKVISEVRKPHTLVPLTGEGHVRTVHGAYGPGILRQNYGADQVAYWHNGGIDGMVSSFTFLPDSELCVVVLTNSTPNYGLDSAVLTWILDHQLGLDDKDYLADFNEKLLKQKDKETETRQLHIDTHDPSLRPSTTPDRFAGTFSDKVYGDLVVDYVDHKLRFAFGSLYQGELVHHQNNSFDLAYDLAWRNASDPGVLNFTLNGSGKVESVLLQFWAEGTPRVRFIVPPEASAKER